MSGFSPDQLKKLVKGLDRSRIQSRERDGRQIDYIEGWFAIAEANAIFGYAGWDREMAHFERIFERSQANGTSCGYLARVRIRVRAGKGVILREGTGFGHASSPVPHEAHERALKAAETDATKRALATFGSRFGLTLYDKDQGGSSRSREGTKAQSPLDPRVPSSIEPRNIFDLKTEDGAILATCLSPEGFCSGLRQMIEAATSVAKIEGLRTNNKAAITMLRAVAPALKSSRGEHYGDILEALIKDRGRAVAVKAAGNGDVTPACVPRAAKSEAIPCLATDLVAATAEAMDAKTPDPEQSPSRAPAYMETSDVLKAPLPPAPKVQVNDTKTADAEPSPSPAPRGTETSEALKVSPPPAPVTRASRIAPGPMIDKSALAIGVTRRIRNKAHLARVGARPCLICEQTPCHAHHVTFAQARGLSVKVSDEFTVPLCALHHNEVHRSGGEETWWRRAGIDPLAEARALWEQSLVVPEPKLDEQSGATAG